MPLFLLVVSASRISVHLSGCVTYAQNIAKPVLVFKQKLAPFLSASHVVNQWTCLVAPWRNKLRQNECPLLLLPGHWHAVPLPFVGGQRYDRETAPTQPTTGWPNAPVWHPPASLPYGANWRQSCGQYSIIATLQAPKNGTKNAP